LVNFKKDFVYLHQKLRLNTDRGQQKSARNLS